MVGLRISSVFLLLVVVAVAARAQFAHSTGFTVNSTIDAVDMNPGDGVCESAGGQCTLRAAVMETNALSGADTITVPAGVYALTIPGIDAQITNRGVVPNAEDTPAPTIPGEDYGDEGATGDLDLTGQITISGAEAGQTIVDGSAANRLFDVLPGGDAALTGITVRNGYSSMGGGGIRNFGILSVMDVSVEGNHSAVGGGGILSWGTIGIERSSILNNGAVLLGGGLNVGGSAALTNVTVSGNSQGGLRNSGVLQMLNVTIAENTGVGLDDYSLNPATLRNVIIAANGALDCTALLPPHPEGHNLDSDGTCGFSDPSDLPNADPFLGPLADNGGPTQTHALLPGSPAIDAGDDSDCPPTDQRGAWRPAGAGCDIGAYEFAAELPTPVPTPTPSPSPFPPTMSTLAEEAAAGSSSLQVADGSGFFARDAIVINPGGATEERSVIAGLGSLDLAAPLLFTHVLGEQVVKFGQAVRPGDTDCDGSVNSVDALRVLRRVANLAPYSNCWAAGNVGCLDDISAVDALRILRFVAGLPPNLPGGCPEIGVLLVP